MFAGPFFNIPASRQAFIEGVVYADADDWWPDGRLVIAADRGQ
jgi:hypothetical protein